MVMWDEIFEEQAGIPDVETERWLVDAMTV